MGDGSIVGGDRRRVEERKREEWGEEARLDVLFG